MKLTLLCSLFTAILAAEPLAVKWSESPVEFAGKRVVLELKDGTKFDGNWISVTPDSVRFRRSNKEVVAYPKDALAEVRVGQRRIRGRVIGLTVGFYAFVALATQSSGKAGYGIVPGMAGGYLLGRAFDKDTRAVVFLPE